MGDNISYNAAVSASIPVSAQRFNACEKALRHVQSGGQRTVRIRVLGCWQAFWDTITYGAAFSARRGWGYASLHRGAKVEGADESPPLSESDYVLGHLHVRRSYQRKARLGYACGKP